jgi:hypothetical protein
MLFFCLGVATKKRLNPPPNALIVLRREGVARPKNAISLRSSKAAGLSSGGTFILFPFGVSDCPPDGKEKNKNPWEKKKTKPSDNSFFRTECKRALNLSETGHAWFRLFFFVSFVWPRRFPSHFPPDGKKKTRSLVGRGPPQEQGFLSYALRACRSSFFPDVPLIATHPSSYAGDPAKAPIFKKSAWLILTAYRQGKTEIRQHLQEIRTIIKIKKGSSQIILIQTLAPIIRAWQPKLLSTQRTCLVWEPCRYAGSCSIPKANSSIWETIAPFGIRRQDTKKSQTWFFFPFVNKPSSLPGHARILWAYGGKWLRHTKPPFGKKSAERHALGYCPKLKRWSSFSSFLIRKKWNCLNYFIFKMLLRWSSRRHSNKNKKWVKKKYFKKLNGKSRVFCSCWTTSHASVEVGPSTAPRGLFTGGPTDSRSAIVAQDNSQNKYYSYAFYFICLPPAGCYPLFGLTALESSPLA